MITYDDIGIKRQIEDSSTPLVVDIVAPWCKFCTQMDPDITRLAQEKEGSVRFAKCDSDEHPMVAHELGVKTLPLVILYKQGEEVARRGSGDYADLTQWLAGFGL